MLTPFSQPKIRVGYIGLGDHAWEQLLPALCTTPELELTAICSRTPAKLELFGTKFKPKYTTDNWQELINPGLIDAIVVSASPQLHYEVVKACLISNIHCFVEKPPTQNNTQLLELVELAKESTSRTFVGYNFSFSDAYAKLKNTLNNSEINNAKFRFIVGKLNQSMDGFETVLESCLFKMFIHPMHTMYQTFGEYESITLSEQIFENNKFSQVVCFQFRNGSTAVLDWGNYSNRFECRFELTNRSSETGTLDNMGHYEFWNLNSHSHDKATFKSKEKIVFDNSPLLGGYERAGYANELSDWKDAILNNTATNCELTQSLEVYRAIAEVQRLSKIKF